jgi:hypothetical protein
MTVRETTHDQPIPNEADILNVVHGTGDVYTAAIEMAKVREITDPEGRWPAIGGHELDLLGTYDEERGMDRQRPSMDSRTLPCEPTDEAWKRRGLGTSTRWSSRHLSKNECR